MTVREQLAAEYNRCDVRRGYSAEKFADTPEDVCLRNIAALKEYSDDSFGFPAAEDVDASAK